MNLRGRLQAAILQAWRAPFAAAATNITATLLGCRSAHFEGGSEGNVALI